MDTERSVIEHALHVRIGFSYEPICDAVVMSSETFSKLCVKCGSLSERVTTVPKADGTSSFDVLECLECKFVEWVPEAQPDYKS